MAIPEGAKVQDLYIVDCLLPGRVRQLGNTTYLTPRRPVRTTAQDCRIRGGEYVAFDRADYKTALKVWLPAAEESTSVFAAAFIDVLEKNDAVLTAPPLYLAILDRLGDSQLSGSPQFKAIKRAGDEVGDFFFVAR